MFWGQGQTSVANRQFIRWNLNPNIVFSVSGVARTGPSVLSAATWYHVALTHTNGSQNLYLNGSSTPEVSAADTASYTSNDIQTLGVSPLLAFPMNGNQVAWGIWSRILTSTEIANLYNSGNGAQYPFTGL